MWNPTIGMPTLGPKKLLSIFTIGRSSFYSGGNGITKRLVNDNGIVDAFRNSIGRDSHYKSDMYKIPA